jgi:hypothetical protein
MKVLLLALLLHTAPTPAADEATTSAEVMRLSEEMRNLARRQAWKGVDRSFRSLEELGGPLGFDEYMVGALAARQLGYTSQAYDRLTAAARLQPSKEVVDWLFDIDSHYARVRLVGDGTGTAALTVAEPPFDPMQARAIEAAVEEATTLGDFVGMLPEGTYSFGGQAFVVRPGQPVEVVLPCKKKCKGGARADLN